jgi:hypothetical protein
VAQSTIILIGSAVKMRKESAIVLKDEVGYVGLQRAAELLGMNQRAVRNLVSRRRLEAERKGEGVAARLVVSLASVESLRLERQAAGKDSKV